MSARLASSLAALFFMLLGGAQVWLSFRLPDGLGLSPAEPGPGLFPMLVGSLLLISATSVLVQTLAAQRVAESARERFPVDIVLLAAMIGGTYLKVNICQESGTSRLPGDKYWHATACRITILS